MENSINHQLHPNLNSEAYRNLKDCTTISDKQLQVILINDDEIVFLGASNMTDRYWNGTVLIFDSLNFKRHEPAAMKKTENGISDAVCLNDNKYIIGEENGIIQLIDLTIDNDTKVKELNLTGYTCNHDSSVLTLSVFHNKNNFVSGGMDNCIKIWDATEFCILHSYLPAHVDAVSSVATQPESDHVFASCCWNGETLLWDVRKSPAAISLYTANCGLSVVDWKTDCDNILAIGHDDGVIKIIDIRNPNKALFERQVFQRRIQNIKFHPEKPNFAAICADEITVKILDCDQDYSTVSEDDSHSDFVRSLAWHKNELFSCSWDNTIQRRSLPSSE